MNSWGKDRIGGLLLLCFFVSYGLLSQNITLLPAQAGALFTARTLPQTLTVLGICGALWLAIRPSPTTLVDVRPLLWKRFFACLTLMSIYGLTLRPLGFLFATTLFLGTGFTLLGERRVLWIIGIALSLSVAFWALMQLGLGVFLNPWPGPWSRGL